MKYIELCAGIGGFRQGLERVGDFDCVGYAEIDKYASKLYKEYYKDVLFFNYLNIYQILIVYFLLSCFNFIKVAKGT